MIKHLLVGTAALACVAAFAGEASAKSAAQCAADADYAAANATHPLGAAVVGCGLAAIGAKIFGGNDTAAGASCLAGGAVGIGLSAAQRAEIRNQVYADCMNNNTQPIAYTLGKPPSGVDGGYTVGSQDWLDACKARYPVSFQMDGPNAWQYTSSTDGQWHWCNLPN